MLVGFRLDDFSDEKFLADAPHEQFAEQLSRNTKRWLKIKTSGKLIELRDLNFQLRIALNAEWRVRRFGE